MSKLEYIIIAFCLLVHMHSTEINYYMYRLIERDERRCTTTHCMMLKSSTNIHFKLRPLWKHQTRDERQTERELNSVKDKMRDHWGKTNPCLHFPCKYSHFVCLFLCICFFRCFTFDQKSDIVYTLVLEFLLCCGFVVDKKHVVMSKALVALKGGDHCLHSHW